MSKLKYTLIQLTYNTYLDKKLNLYRFVINVIINGEQFGKTYGEKKEETFATHKEARIRCVEQLKSTKQKLNKGFNIHCEKLTIKQAKNASLT